MNFSPAHIHLPDGLERSGAQATLTPQGDNQTTPAQQHNEKSQDAIGKRESSDRPKGIRPVTTGPSAQGSTVSPAKPPGSAAS